MTELGQTVGGPLYFWVGIAISIGLIVGAIRASSREIAAWMILAVPFAGLLMASGPAFFEYSPIWGDSNSVAFRLWGIVFAVATLGAVARPRRRAWSH